MSDAAQRIISLYDDKAEGWIADRSRTLGLGGPVMNEKMALDLFAQALPRGGAVLDVGCGYGWPWGAALLQRGFRVTGVDTSPRLIAHAAETLTDGEWICDDMRRFDLGRTFDGLLVWFSLFHLTPDDQRAALVRILAHAAPRATLLMTAGWGEGVIVGEWRGEPLYHASLAAEDYDAILTQAGFQIRRWDEADEGGLGTHILLARRG